MSHYDYITGRRIQAKGYPFYAVLQAAMRQADSYNLEKLRTAFPEVWADLQARYHAPRGLLPEEKLTPGLR